MIIKGQDMENIQYGDSFTDDRHVGKRFDYMLANPPFGVEWKPQEDVVKKEYKGKSKNHGIMEGVNASSAL